MFKTISQCHTFVTISHCHEFHHSPKYSHTPQNPKQPKTSRNKHSDEQYDHEQQIFTNSMSNLNYLLIMSSEYTHVPESRMAKYVSVHTLGQYMWCAARVCTPPQNARTLLQAAPVVSEHSCVCVCARVCVCACVSV